MKPQQNSAEGVGVREALNTIHNWLVCWPITTPADMMSACHEMEQLAAAALLSDTDTPTRSGEAMNHWRQGAAIIEQCLEVAKQGRTEDAPIPYVGNEAKIWHAGRVEAFRHALEMMGPPLYASPPQEHTPTTSGEQPDVPVIIGALKAALAAEDAEIREAFIRAALDFAENDPEILAEGRAWAPALSTEAPTSSDGGVS